MGKNRHKIVPPGIAKPARRKIRRRRQGRPEPFSQQRYCKRKKRSFSIKEKLRLLNLRAVDIPEGLIYIRLRLIQRKKLVSFSQSIS